MYKKIFGLQRNTFVFFAVVLIVFVYYTVTSVLGGTTVGLTLTNNPDLEQGLVGHWTFDGAYMRQNVGDSSGEENHGTLNNFTSTTSAVAIGKIGQGLRFNGTDTYVGLGNPTELDFAEDTPMSLSAWVRVNTFPGTGNLGDIVSKGLNASVVAAYGLTISEDGFPEPTLTVGSYNPTDADQHATASIASWATHEWHHVVGQYTGTQWELYIDGVLVDTTIDSGPEDNDRDVFIGAFDSNGTPARFFDGDLDDVRIYDRALSGEEVSRLYDLGATTKINKTLTSNTQLDDGLVTHLTFDGKDLVDNATDVSGNGNDGMLDGFSATTTVPGTIGQGLSFNGATDNVVVAGDVFSDTGSMCIWVRFDGTQTGGQTVLQENTAGYLDWDMSDADTIEISFYDSSFKNLNIDVQNHVWHHICGVWNTSEVIAYRDGIEITSDTFAGLNSSATGLTVGSDRNGTQHQSFFGDEVRVYNRALSPEEIRRLYDLGATTKINKTIQTNDNLTDGLIGFWTFDGGDMVHNVADRSGNNHTAYLIGFTSTTTMVGRQGQAIYLTDTSDYIDVSTSTHFDTMSALSLSAWIKPDVISTGRIVAKSYDSTNSTANTGWVLRTSDNGSGLNDALSFQVDFDTGNLVCTTANFVLKVDQWSHVVVTWNGGTSNSTDLSLYLNNVKLSCSGFGSSSATGSQVDDTTTPLRIGSNSEAAPSASSHFKGGIDNVRIYNRVLNTKEITDLYTQNK